MKRLKVGYLIDPVREIHPEYDTSFALMKECARRGHAVYCCELKDLRKHDSTVEARLTKYRPDPLLGLAAESAARWTRISELDALFIRKDPPFDMRYVSALTLLIDVSDASASRAGRTKPFMINHPAGILETNEKLSALDFAPFCPPSVAGSTPEAFQDFLKRPSKLGWVFKPLFFKGGRGVSWIRPGEKGRVNALVKRLTRDGREPIVCQRFVEHSRSGDKRILILDGRILGAMRRIAKPGEFRANLSKGAVAASAVVTAKEKRLVKRLAPFFKRRGLHLVGIDVLSGYLSEINVTSPSGAPEINAFNGGRVESAVIDLIEKKAGADGRVKNR
jgi:glutathione synthase